MLLDGTLLPIDRITADRPYYSGKHKRHGMNVQVLADPFGRLPWASPALPGTVHDIRAAREHGLVDALAEAIPLFERTLQERVRVLGEDHPHTLTSRNNLAHAYETAGELARAIPLYEQALNNCVRVLGEEHPATSLGLSRASLSGA
ncbi:hypothetical protein SHO565_73750 [Streptomyces sp. HO565]